MATPRKSTAKTADKRALGLANSQRISAASWYQSTLGEEIEVPSGNVALLRRPGPEMFLQNGVVPDALAPIVEQGIRDKQGLPPDKAAEIAKDGQMLPQVMAMMDAAVLAAVIEPKVQAEPTCIRPSGASKAKAFCDAPFADAVHHDKKADDYHLFVAGDRIPFPDRNPEFLYVGEVDLQDKLFIFQYAVGGTRDVERFREEYEQSLAGIQASAESA